MRKRLPGVGCQADLQPPAAQQGRPGAQHMRVVVQDQAAALQRPGGLAAGAGRAGPRGGCGQLQPEAGARAQARLQAMLRAHQVHAACHHGQPEPVALAVDVPGLLRAVEGLVDAGAVFQRHAQAGVPHLDAPVALPPPRADEHAALRRVAQRVVHQVGQRLAQQRGVGLHGSARWRHVQPQAQPTRAGLGQELDLQFVEKRAQ